MGRRTALGGGSCVTHILTSSGGVGGLVSWGSLAALAGRGCMEGGCSSPGWLVGRVFTTLSRLSRLKQLQMNHHKAITLAFSLPSLWSLSEPPGRPSAGIWCAYGPPRDSGLRVSSAHWGAGTLTGTEGRGGCGSKCFFKVYA